MLILLFLYQKHINPREVAFLYVKCLIVSILYMFVGPNKIMQYIHFWQIFLPSKKRIGHGTIQISNARRINNIQSIDSIFITNFFDHKCLSRWLYSQHMECYFYSIVYKNCFRNSLDNKTKALHNNKIRLYRHEPVILHILLRIRVDLMSYHYINIPEIH